MKHRYAVVFLGLSIIVMSTVTEQTSAKPRINGCTAHQIQSNQPGIQACADRIARDIAVGGGAHTEMVCVGEQVNCCSNDKNGNTMCTFAGTAAPRVTAQPGTLNPPPIKRRGVDGGQPTESAPAGESVAK
ncbi:MAG: hypothetical protein U0231_01100 [Nitrospiraceae bacterium]